MTDTDSATLAGAPADSQTPVVATFSKKKNRGHIRKRTVDTDEPGDTTDVAVTKSKFSKAGAAAFTTKKAEDEKLQTFKFESAKTLQQQTDQGATRSLETETQTDRDARYMTLLPPPPPPPPPLLLQGPLSFLWARTVRR